jgi:hypothetical protein
MRFASASSPRALRRHVMDIEIPEGSAFLTTPTVAFQDQTTHRRLKPWYRLNSLSFLRRRVIHLASSLRKPSAPNLQVNRRWSSDTRYLVRIFRSPKQRPPGSRHRSFPGNNHVICHFQASRLPSRARAQPPQLAFVESRKFRRSEGRPRCRFNINLYFFSHPGVSNRL